MHHPPSVRSSALVAVHEDLQVHHAAEPLVVEDEDALDHDDLARLHERGLGTASVRGEVVLRNLHVLPVPQLAYGFAATAATTAPSGSHTNNLMPNAS